MALTKYKLGELIEQRREKYNYEEKLPIRGVSREGFISPKQDGADLSIYNVYYRNDFVFNPARMELNSIALNLFWDKAICSSLYEIFYVTRTDIVLPEYLNMFIKRDEFARKCWFEAVGSARNYFRVGDLAEFEISLPPIDLQQKYVDIYNAMVSNQECYERGLEDLKLTCDAYIEDLRRNMPCEEIGPYLRECNEKNEGNAITLFQGVNVDHVFTEPKRVAEDSENGSVVRTGQFAFNKVMKSNRTKLPIALREGPDCVVSNSYQVFEITDTKKLNPKYLLMWFNRTETQRYAGFISFGTTRDIFTFEDMGKITIPIPSVEIQQDVVDIFTVYQERSEINERLKMQLKDICPILIKGSLEEARKEA
ncbi:restriction endonuclease subunit S [uncultured Peptoniphilus sp.]|uniref:restriction endonuclease subunit S n=1 Tax=uncultured Peptoniphilus sp. TaxID=254354 RepID=UPI002617DCF5|nr:restriction endonuclease subunit S [uncultured Peptoniphilus sp.]